jgi:hypothetical protein
MHCAQLTFSDGYTPFLTRRHVTHICLSVCIYNFPGRSEYEWNQTEGNKALYYFLETENTPVAKRSGWN